MHLITMPIAIAAATQPKVTDLVCYDCSLVLTTPRPSTISESASIHRNSQGPCHQIIYLLKIKMIERLTDKSPSINSEVKTRVVNALQSEPPKRRKEARMKWRKDVLRQIDDFVEIQEFDINFYEGNISQSPLWQATQQGSTFKTLLERKKPDLNQSDQSGRTAILFGN